MSCISEELVLAADFRVGVGARPKHAGKETSGRTSPGYTAKGNSPSTAIYAH